MADDYEDDYDFWDEGGDYDYLEDGYALADDLAANTVPDPPQHDDLDYWDDQSRYEYWNDIEYDSDGYNDVQTKLNTSKKTAPATGRKRRQHSAVESASKRRKLEQTTSDSYSNLPPILLLKKDSIQNRPAPTVDVATLTPYAVLPDWRERFSSFDHLRSSALAVQTPHNENTNIENDEEQAIGTDALKFALQKHLSTLGLDAKDFQQNMLLQLAESMMAGDDEGDELLDQLVEQIHAGNGQEKESDSFSKYISGQVKSDTPQEAQNVSEDSKKHPDNMELLSTNSAADSTSPPSGSSKTLKRKADDSPKHNSRKKKNRPPDRVSARG